jgi:hypothetical protein
MANGRLIPLLQVQHIENVLNNLEATTITPKRLSIAVVIMIALSYVLGSWAASTRAENSEFYESAEQEEIKHVIESYFEVRYHSLDSLQLEGFEKLIGKSSDGGNLFRSELDKLEVEIQHAKRYHLRYSQYKFFLDFKEISIDLSAGEATVSAVEGHDVVFEISEEIFKSQPVISSMRNLQHTIIMHNEQGGWKIVSDSYEDYLWRLMKTTGVSKEVLLQSMAEPLSQSPVIGVQAANACSLPSDESTHPYTRNSAVAYAHRWATAEPPYNHPPYDDFTNLGGDCTNFVSQAIHEGDSA